MGQCLEAKKYTILATLTLHARYAWPADIWAMGVILYELCALKLPFDGGIIMHHLDSVHSELSACVFLRMNCWRCAVDVIGYSYLGDTSINSLQVSLQILRAYTLSELLGRVQHGDPCAEHNSGSSSATARGWRSIASMAWFRFAMAYMVYYLFAYVLPVEALSICKPDSSKQVNGQRFAFWINFHFVWVVDFHQVVLTLIPSNASGTRNTLHLFARSVALQQWGSDWRTESRFWLQLLCHRMYIHVMSLGRKTRDIWPILEEGLDTSSVEILARMHLATQYVA